MFSRPTASLLRYKRVLLAALALLISPNIFADSLSVYTAQGIDTNLLSIPGRILTNDLTFEQSYFVGLGYLTSIQTPEVLSQVGSFLGASYVTSDIEFVGVKHHGMQENYETDIAYSVHLPPAELWFLSVRFGAAMGLSYAWGTPSYEDGPEGNPERRYRLQNFNNYELEWRHREAQHFSFVTRIHHRSGMYGVIAPRHVGSNFFTLGLRYAY
ncbi:MAG TPA: hypothetical protein VGE50_12085 [Gammaproteobacteria bacterium]